MTQIIQTPTNYDQLCASQKRPIVKLFVVFHAVVAAADIYNILVILCSNFCNGCTNVYLLNNDHQIGGAIIVGIGLSVLD